MSIANTVVLDLMLLCYSIVPFEEFFFRVMALMNSGFCGLYCCLELLICEYNLLCIQLRQEIKAPACLAAKTFIIKSYFSIFFFDPTEPLQPLQFSNYPHFVVFFLSGFSFTTIHKSQDCRGRGRAFLFISSIPLPPASETLRHQPGDYSRALPSAHRQQPDSNQEPLVSKRKLLTTKLCALKLVQHLPMILFSYTML